MHTLSCAVWYNFFFLSRSMLLDRKKNPTVKYMDLKFLNDYWRLAAKL